MSNPSDFSVEVTNETGGTDYRWLRDSHGTTTGITGTLDLATAKGLRGVANSLGVLPSGVALGQITDTERYGLFDPAATDGREVLAGFLIADTSIFNNKGVVNPSGKAAASVLKHAMIARTYLPVEAQRTSITYLTASTGSFVLVD